MALTRHLKSAARAFFDLIFAPLVISAGYRVSRHIPLALQRNATIETAEYVRRHMAHVRAFPSSRDLLKWSAQLTARQEGLILEFGVFEGDSLRLLAREFGERIYGFDSFKGLPDDWRSSLPAGTFALPKAPVTPPNVELVVGWFNETLHPFLAQHPGPIKFLHIDCDLYSSTVDVLKACASRLSAGSVILFDEYFNYPGWQEGEFKAFQEAIASHDLRYRYLGYVETDEQVAVQIV